MIWKPPRREPPLVEQQQREREREDRGERREHDPGIHQRVAAWWVAISRRSRRSSSAEASSYSDAEARGIERAAPAEPGQLGQERPARGDEQRDRLGQADVRRSASRRARSSTSISASASAAPRAGPSAGSASRCATRAATSRRPSFRYAVAIVVVDRGPDQVGRGIGGAVAPPVDPLEPLGRRARGGKRTADGRVVRRPMPGRRSAARRSSARRSKRRWPPGVV